MKLFNLKPLRFTLVWCFLASGCATQPDTFGKLNLKKWRADRGACKNDRAGLTADFRAEQNRLMGKFIDEIGTILGRPDINQLGERNQKFYVYFLEKGPQCDDITKNVGAKKVILRFNAVGLLSEITYQDRALE